jgi:DNA-binding IclR family transcriptional regulator
MLLTKIDSLFEILEENRKVSVHSLARTLNIPPASVIRINRYLESLGFASLECKNILEPGSCS